MARACIRTRAYSGYAGLSHSVAWLNCDVDKQKLKDCASTLGSTYTVHEMIAWLMRRIAKEVRVVMRM